MTGLGWSGAQAPAPAKVVRVAAAADLQPVLPAFAAAYEKQTGVKLEVSFGSSSELATQIQNGAPFDVFLSADFVFPEKIVAAGLAVEPEAVAYAKGTLVLWSKRDLAAPLSMDLLTNPKVTRIAIADEFRAPYGRAAYAALRQLKLYDRVQGKLVVGENIAQTAQFAETGNAQMGFISLTLAESPRLKAEGQYIRVPAVYPEIRQCAVVMKAGKNSAGGVKFLDWFRSGPVQDHLAQFGLQAVE